jgi:Flp pilus assembly protein TadG
MAIVLPLLLMLVFGIAEFGIAFTQWQSLTNATREGARVGVVFRSPCNAGTVTTLVQNTVATFAASSGLTGTVSTTVTGACGGVGTPLTVTTSVPFNYATLSAIAGLAPTVNLNASSTMRNE